MAGRPGAIVRSPRRDGASPLTHRGSGVDDSSIPASIPQSRSNRGRTSAWLSSSLPRVRKWSSRSALMAAPQGVMA